MTRWFQTLLIGIGAVGIAAVSPSAKAEPFLGEIRFFAGNFAPNGWAFCDGQLLSISQNTALFSILGTIYGGDGQTTFGLPDLRGRSPVHPGSGPGLTTIQPGQKGGAETTTLNEAQLAPHNHLLGASSSFATELAADGNVLASKSRSSNYAESASVDVDLADEAIGDTGLGQPVPIRSPYTGIRCIIALQGIFPSQ